MKGLVPPQEGERSWEARKGRQPRPLARYKFCLGPKQCSLGITPPCPQQMAVCIWQRLGIWDENFAGYGEERNHCSSYQSQQSYWGHLTAYRITHCVRALQKRHSPRSSVASMASPFLLSRWSRSLCPALYSGS